ncbi:MAG: hypothetical protein OEY63_07820, partial [Gemmatimonadota bacterium]|nr:hypothetical protein [Gemmatimonadota bacterium]
WNVTWSNAELRTALRETLPSRIGIDPARVESIQDVSVYATGPSGRATELRVHVPAGAIPIFGADVRAVFRLPDGGTLNSTAIQLSSESSGEGLVSLTAAGAGFGHGVGMCQWGAIGRARAGQNARQILTTYFPGVSFANWS